MSLGHVGTEPVEDDEIIYRRIPVSKGWYSNGGISPEAFEPRDDELTGISFCRAKYNTPEQAAVGLGKPGYYVASYSVAALRRLGILVEQRPCAEVAGHTELPQITSKTRDQNATLELQKTLAGMFIEVLGPFLPTK